MSEIVPQELQARKSAIAQIRVVAQAERRKQVGREKILEILVTLPDCNGPPREFSNPAAPRAPQVLVQAPVSSLEILECSVAAQLRFPCQLGIRRARDRRSG